LNSQFERRRGSRQEQLDISILSSGSYERDNTSQRSRTSSNKRSSLSYGSANARDGRGSLSYNKTKSSVRSSNTSSNKYDAGYLRGNVDSKPRSRHSDLDVSIFDFNDFDERNQRSRNSAHAVPSRSRSTTSSRSQASPSRSSQASSRSRSSQASYGRASSQSARRDRLDVPYSRSASPRYRQPARSSYSRTRTARRQPKKRISGHTLLAVFEIVVVVGVILFARSIFQNMGGIKIMDNLFNSNSSDEAKVNPDVPDWVDVQYIDEGNPSRSGQKLEAVHDIVVHYVGNPGTTAQQNHDFYNDRKSDVCSHFLVGMEGEVILCIPLDEKSAASNHRNRDTISIEVCHPDSTGKFTDASYQATLKLVDWLLDEYNLTPDHVIRHYDVTGKECPKYFVDHPDEWEEFKSKL